MSKPDPSRALPAALNDALEADLRPVRPLRLGRSLSVVVAVFVGAAAFAIFSSLGLRGDLAVLGTFGAWGISGLEMAVAAALLALALREAIPGRGSSRAALLAGVVVALLMAVAAAFFTDLRSPMDVPPGMGRRFALICFAVKLGLGVPVVGITLALVAQGSAARPWRAGLLAGFGAGMVGDALWRLGCPFSELEHVLLSHGGGLLAVVASGSLLAWLGQLWRDRAWQQRRARQREAESSM